MAVINTGSEIQLGGTARDSISGFTGVVVARTEWLHGCWRLTLQSRALHDGKPIDAQTFDAPQLERVGPATIAAGTKETGGPRPEPVRSPSIGR